MSKTITVYVDLPEEESPTMRPTKAESLGNGLFRILPADDYNPRDEIWEFPPGSIVRVEKRVGKIGEYLYAISLKK